MLASLPRYLHWLPLFAALLALCVPRVTFAVTAEEAFGYCGDHICNTYEDCESCAPDCGECECGNGIAISTEECDTDDFKGEDCESFGYDSGELACTDNCEIDQSDCTFDDCGDGQITGPEECDGSDLDGYTCEDYGYDGGDLSCTDNCQIDLSDCYECGDDYADETEECDGSDLKGETCESYGYDHGELSCTDNCELDQSDCYDHECGDGVLDEGEECDDGNTIADPEDGCDETCHIQPGWFCPLPPALAQAFIAQLQLANTHPQPAPMICFPLCGNGTVDDGSNDTEDNDEECDDGNTDDNDGCSADCKNEYCGDGVINVDPSSGYLDQCDQGSGNSDDSPNACRTDCTLPYCGDGITDGDYSAALTSPTNSPSASGNMASSSSSNQANAANNANNASSSSQGGGEECDDGNDENYDGCYDCEIEPLYCCVQYTKAGVPSEEATANCHNSRLEYDPFTCQYNCSQDFCQTCGGGGFLDVLFCGSDYCDQMGCAVGQTTPIGWALELIGFPWNFQSNACDINPACNV